VTETSSGRARGRAGARRQDAVGDDPFALLGLPARPGLSDDDVRAAWRRVAAATHPDREDGGDAATFGAAAAAYVLLRTGFGRGEALADLGVSAAADRGGRHAHRARPPANVVGPAGRHRARRGPNGAEPPASPPAEATLAADTPVAAGGQPWTIAAPGPQWPEPNQAPRQPAPRGRGQHGRSRAAGWRLKPPPGGMAWRVAGAAVVGVVAAVISGWSPGLIGVLAGVLTWLLALAGQALARRRSR